MLYKVFYGDQIILEHCEYSSSLFFRFKGLLGRSLLQDNEGILLKPCNSIHMFFMKFPIDAVFLDKGNNVVRIYRNILPWRATPIIWSAHSVLEVKAGKADALKIGDVLSFTPIDKGKS